eukprot:6753713-Prymnesium_polylepis.1
MSRDDSTIKKSFQKKKLLFAEDPAGDLSPRRTCGCHRDINMSLAHQPEVLIAGLSALAGLGLGYYFELAITAALLLVLAVVAYVMLSPPTHPMGGYGALGEGDTVRAFATWNARPPKLNRQLLSLRVDCDLSRAQVPTCPPQGTVLIDGASFKDEHGRTLLLRGVNLSGASKLPTSPASVTSTSTPARDSAFYDHRNVSFVGRPFPLEVADEHFARLRLWGLTFLRLLITWEAIEHGGPGVYGQEYLQYLLAVVRKAAAHGISVFIDPHMDTWSRFSGGDGAPGWTLEVAGFDLRTIHASGAASLHQEEEGGITMMAWPTNNLKLAAATMYTLFFAGACDACARQQRVRTGRGGAPALCRNPCRACVCVDVA